MDFIYIDDSVAVSVAPPAMPSMVRGFVSSQAVAGQGGTSPYTYTISAGALPAGLSLVGDTVAGTPNVAGAYDFTIAATDSIGRIGTRRYTGTIATPVITITPSSLTTLTLGVAASVDFNASGGSGAYTWELSSGSLPAGLALNASSGVVSGTPTAIGAYVCTLRATDAYGNSGTLSLSGSVLDPYPIGYQLQSGPCRQDVTIACVGTGTWSANPAYGTMIASGTMEFFTVGEVQYAKVFGSIMQEDGNGRLNFRYGAGGGGGVYGIDGYPGAAYFQMPGTPSGRRWRLDYWDDRDEPAPAPYGGMYRATTPATITRVA